MCNRFDIRSFPNSSLASIPCGDVCRNGAFGGIPSTSWDQAVRGTEHGEQDWPFLDDIAGILIYSWGGSLRRKFLWIQ